MLWNSEERAARSRLSLGCCTNSVDRTGAEHESLRRLQSAAQRVLVRRVRVGEFQNVRVDGQLVLGVETGQARRTGRAPAESRREDHSHSRTRTRRVAARDDEDRLRRHGTALVVVHATRRFSLRFSPARCTFAVNIARADTKNNVK